MKSPKESYNCYYLTVSARPKHKILGKPYVFLKHLWESTLNPSETSTKNFSLKLCLHLHPEAMFFWQHSRFALFLEVFLTLRSFCRLERLSKRKNHSSRASSNIFLSFFQSFIEKLFKDWQAFIYLVPKPECHRFFLWNSPDFWFHSQIMFWFSTF